MDFLEEVNLQIKTIKERQKQHDILKRQIQSTNYDLEKKKQERNDFKQILLKEQKDVELLTSFSMKNLFTTIFKNKDEELSREQRELLDAKMHMEHIDAEINSLIDERNHYINKENDYIDEGLTIQKLLVAKEDYIKKNFPQYLKKFREIDISVEMAQEMMIEIDEAITVGHNALQSLNSARKTLKSAQNWGAWDIMGGGIISHVNKHENIRTANHRISTAKRILNRYNKELRDIHFDTNVSQVYISDMDHTMDFWFDNIFTDMAIQNKIRDGLYRVDKSIHEVRTTLTVVENMKNQKIRHIADLKNEKSQIIDGM